MRLILKTTPIFIYSLPLRSHFTTFNRHPNSATTNFNPISTSITMATASKVSDNEAGTARRLWLRFRKESILALYTPFVVSLASGKLRVETFRHYIAQDVHFLKAFAQAYEMAEDCADDDDDKVAISELRKSVLQELKMHDSFVKEWGADLIKDNAVNSATIKYRDFLLATALGKIEGVKGGPAKLATPFEKTIVAAYTLAAMTPCMRLYAYIGKELQSFLDTNQSDHPYAKWIQNYSSEYFEGAALKTEDLLDKLSVSLTGEELGVIEKLYHQAMKLEIDFFAAQPLVQQTVVPLSKAHNPDEQGLVIFSDFDLTCTIVDSSAILAEIAIVTAPKSDQNHVANQIVRMPSADLRHTWGVLSGQYTEEYEQCIESILKTKNAEKFDYEVLSKALKILSDFERRANTRVIESGVLKGLALEDIKRAGERLLFQDGCTGFFKNVLMTEKLDAKVHILSYCWCADLIRSAFSAGGLNVLNVHANEFAYRETTSTGEIVKKVESPIDKIEVFKNILEKEKNEKRKNITIYIGDSVGDLLCLLAADVGIVLGSSSSLRRVGTHFGVSFVPLFPGLIRKQKDSGDGISSWKGLSGVVYTVSSWAEIHAFILGS